ncbi:MAG: GvpL/GvpF family gas vesicle protein [Terriglobales bacterium]|jgi:hypothetical protein
MSYLLYCIFRSPPQLEREAVTGVGAQPVSVIEHDGLGGAISELRKADSDPDVGSVLAYESVAETFFRQRTIIPMRYGCAVHNRRDFGPLIDKHRKECDTLLRRLEGLAEMAIQVSASGGEEDDEICLAAIPQTRWPDSNRSGASYLSGKKLYYRGADRKVERQNEFAQAVCRPLAGLFVERKVELPSRATSLLMLYFLVPRSSVDAFRETSRRALQNQFEDVRISGPWPPYNFATFSDDGRFS